MNLKTDSTKVYMQIKKICAITMARNDTFFLTRWIDYYGAQLGKENLYIYLDGLDQPIPGNADGVNVIHCERIEGQVVGAEKRRLGHLSSMAAELFGKYDIVIGTDADEFLIVDPNCNETLKTYLSKTKINSSLSGLGLDVGQKIGEEDIIDRNRSFLSQRSYAVLSPRYTKPSILARPVRWGSGFHRIKGKNYKIDRNLFLFHFGVFDMKMVEDRFKDKDRMAAGWERHMKKRTKTITSITRKKALDRKYTLSAARVVQTIFRPIFAWNKPTMFGINPVIRIPERFKDNPLV